MSIPIDLDRLATALHDFGAGYLVTSGDDGRAKVVTVDPVVEDATILLPPSKGSARNLAANPTATLVFPPTEPKGYTLLVDGTASVDPAATEGAIRFTAETAVLHRPAAHGDGPPPPAGAGDQTGCENDCRPA